MGDGNCWTLKNPSKSTEVLYHKGVIETNTFSKSYAVTWPVHWPVKKVCYNWTKEETELLLFLSPDDNSNRSDNWSSWPQKTQNVFASTLLKVGSHWRRFNDNHGLYCYVMFPFNGNTCKWNLCFVNIFWIITFILQKPALETQLVLGQNYIMHNCIQTHKTETKILKLRRVSQTHHSVLTAFPSFQNTIRDSCINTGLWCLWDVRQRVYCGDC